MSYDIIPTISFVKQLSKKHCSIKDDLAALAESLQEDPKQGDGPGRQRL